LGEDPNYYIYIVNDQNKLIGIISIKELFRTPKNTKVSHIMKKALTFVHPYADQEKVALLALQHNLKAIPVIDKNKNFLGVVPSDIVLNILHNETVEDALHSAGVHKFDLSATSVIKAPAIKMIKLRLPWLLLGLGGGVLAAQIVGFFEEALSKNLILAMFIPVVVYMSDAAATQTETLFIRSLALNQHLIIKNYFIREIKIGFVIALTCSSLLSIISIIWWKMPYLGLILGTSLFSAIIFAMSIALLIPIILNKFKKDPAIGSGPFATIITDILSLTIYFLIASTILEMVY